MPDGSVSENQVEAHQDPKRVAVISASGSQLFATVRICGCEGTDPQEVALAAAGALYGWALGEWGPLELEIRDVRTPNSRGPLLAITIDASEFAAGASGPSLARLAGGDA